MWNEIKTVGPLLARVSKKALPWLLFALLHVAVWWFGPSLEWQGEKPIAPWVSRLLVSSALLLIAALVWGWSLSKKLRTQAAPEPASDTETKNEEPDEPANSKAFTPDDIVDAQDVAFKTVLDEMVDHVDMRIALYDQPWYVVLGDQASGKSALIQHSGLRFLFSSSRKTTKAEGDHEKAPLYVDWWIGNDAVVIEPGYELITQHGDVEIDVKSATDTNAEENEEDKTELPLPNVHARLWTHFIEWLEKTRCRRPLNGVIVTLDVTQLISGGERYQKEQGKAVRARLAELMETVSSRLPVYVVLTKCDALYGFEPLFRYCSLAEREALLGVTCAFYSHEHPNAWLDDFSQDHDRLVARLHQCFARFADRHTENDRKAMLSFVRQISGLKTGLQSVLEALFAHDKNVTPALLRGAYLTSTTQQGVPRNVFDEAIAHHYHLGASFPLEPQTRASSVYFASSLFSHLILPESGLATDNLRVLKQKHRIMKHATIACSLCTLSLLVGWQISYNLNHHRAASVLSKVQQYQQSERDIINRSESLTAMLKVLEPIRSAMLTYGFFHDKSKYTAEMGLYQGHLIGPKIEETYLTLLKRQYLPSLMATLVADMQQAESSEEQLKALRVYRMLTDQSGRQDNMVMNHFAHLWHCAFPGQRETQEALLRHLKYALKHTDLEGERVGGDELADDALRRFDSDIADVQTQLSQLPSEERVYQNLRASAQSVLGAPLDLKLAVGPTFDVVFQSREGQEAALSIPRLLTKEGFERYFLPQMRSVSTLALTDDWVLGLSSTTDFDEAEKAALDEKVQALYIADYTRTWRSALNAIEMRPLTRLDDGILALDHLVGSAMPLQALLDTLNDNTDFYPELPDDEVAKKALMSSVPYQMSMSIKAPFSRLTAMLDSESDDSEQLLTVLRELDNDLKSIQEAPDRGMAALEMAKTHVTVNQVDSIFSLTRLSRGLPAPLDGLFEPVAQDSENIIKQEAFQYLNVRWQQDVVAVFDAQLAHLYPFDEHSNKDVSLKDFEAFFAPEGVLDAFYSQYLEWFIDDTRFQSETSHIIREEVLDELQQAKRIQQAFFDRKGEFGVSFVMEPTYLSGNKLRSLMNIDGQTLSYSHGSRDNVEMVWPNVGRDLATSKVTLMPTTRNVSPRSVIAKGPWAFFHLLDLGRVTSASAATVDYEFAVDGGVAGYHLSSGASVNPFTEHVMREFTLSESLY